jgi:hypothetical protein
VTLKFTPIQDINDGRWHACYPTPGDPSRWTSAGDALTKRGAIEMCNRLQSERAKRTHSAGIEADAQEAHNLLDN